MQQGGCGATTIVPCFPRWTAQKSDVSSKDRLLPVFGAVYFEDTALHGDPLASPANGPTPRTFQLERPLPSRFFRLSTASWQASSQKLRRSAAMLSAPPDRVRFDSSPMRTSCCKAPDPKTVTGAVFGDPLRYRHDVVSCTRPVGAISQRRHAATQRILSWFS